MRYLLHNLLNLFLYLINIRLLDIDKFQIRKFITNQQCALHNYIMPKNTCIYFRIFRIKPLLPTFTTNSTMHLKYFLYSRLLLMWNDHCTDLSQITLDRRSNRLSLKLTVNLAWKYFTVTAKNCSDYGFNLFPSRLLYLKKLRQIQMASDIVNNRLIILSCVSCQKMIYVYINSPVIYIILALELTRMRCSGKTGPVSWLSVIRWSKL